MNRLDKFILYKPYFYWFMSALCLVEAFWMTYKAFADIYVQTNVRVVGALLGLFFGWACFDFAKDALKIHAGKTLEKELEIE